jgi:ABC-2 type transport system ATP-binding protein
MGVTPTSERVGFGRVRVAPGRAAVSRLSGVGKQFGDRVVLRDVDLVVPAGTVVGVVGGSGSGKTTVACLAVGLLPPDEGVVELLGRDPWDGGRRPVVGLVPDRVPVSDRLSCREVLLHVALGRGFPPGVASRRVDSLLAVCQLADSAGVVVAECTAGQRLLVRLAATLLGEPRLLVFDDALDVDRWALDVVRAVSREFAAAGGGVLCVVGEAWQAAWCDVRLELAPPALRPLDERPRRR